MLEAWR